MATIGSWTKLGAVVRDARKVRNLSQAEAAARAGVSRSWLARVEAGHRAAELEPLLRLFSALDLTLTLEDSMPTPEADSERPPPSDSPERPPPPKPAEHVPAAPTSDALARVAAMQANLEVALSRHLTPTWENARSEALRKRKAAQGAIEQQVAARRKTDDAGQ